MTMGSYFGRSNSPKSTDRNSISSSRPYSNPHPAHSQTSLYSSSSPVSQMAPVLPPIPRIVDVADANKPNLGLGVDQHIPLDSSPLRPTVSASSATSSPLRDMPTLLEEDSPSSSKRPQYLAAGRSMTSPEGALPKPLKHASTSSPLGAYSVPYDTTTAQAKPRPGNRPLPAESTINGVPQHAKMSKQKPEIHSQKSSKGKFNLLNPVNLLMRRRSAQAVETLERSASKTLTVPPMNMPDDYDPRIRGNVVHDFSAPKARRTPSYDPAMESSPKPSTAHESIQSEENPFERDSRMQSVQHTPVFVEHIESDQESSHDRIHAETLANNEFVARNSWCNSGESLSMPPFGRRSQQIEEHYVSPVLPQGSSSNSPRSDVSALSSPQWHDYEADQSPSSVSPNNTEPIQSEHLGADAHAGSDTQLSDHCHPPSDCLEPSHSSGLPRHLTSTASRFSFQIANDSIAEEKLLEEKHKLSRSQAVQEGTQYDDEEDEEEDIFDEDALYDHDEMEDLGANNFYEHRNTGLSQRMSAMTLESQQSQMSMSSSSILYPDHFSLGQNLQTRNLAQQNPVQLNPLAQNPLPHNQLSQNPLRQNPIHSTAPSDSPAHHQFDTHTDTVTAQSDPDPPSPKSQNSMYFDDGTFDAIDELHDDGAFDEDNFDDPTYLKKPPQPKETATSSPESHHETQVHNVNGHAFLIQNPGTRQFSSESPHSEGSPLPVEASQGAARHDSQQGLPDVHNTTAYHVALAEAANRAAADGKFTRHNSIAASDSVYSDDQGGFEHDYYKQPDYAHQRFASASTHQTRTSYSGFEFGFNDSSTIEDTFSSPEFPNDDFDFDDDDIISAANAEALANDDEGFYGQEFGFYARSRSGSDVDAAEAINGGYFGAPGIEIIRQKSVKEPNLTPITERSEFSARNSWMGPFSPMSAALPSPGFPPAHMAAARMSPLAWAHMPDDEMTLADLRRLKQGTFAGSTGSLNSAASSFGGQLHSPVSANQPPGGYFMPRAGFGGVPMAAQRSSDSNSNDNPSNHSSSPIAASPVHVSSSLSNSQTLNMALPNPQTFLLDADFSTPKKNISKQQDAPSTPVTAKKSTPAAPGAEFAAPAPVWQTHSRSSSGADNITYVREEDSAGTKRWILERRRTSEAGLLELVGREVVDGGRI